MDGYIFDWTGLKGSKVQKLIDNAYETQIQNNDKGYVTGKLYIYLNLAKKLMSTSTNRHSNSSKSVSCISTSFPQWFDSKCPITESSSGGMSQRGQGWLPFPWWFNTLLNDWSPLVCET